MQVFLNQENTYVFLQHEDCDFLYSLQICANVNFNDGANYRLQTSPFYGEALAKVYLKHLFSNDQLNIQLRKTSNLWK